MPDDPAKGEFVYVAYIASTPERVFEALIRPEFTRRYWSGTWQDCDWKVGSPWQIVTPDGRVADSGEVLVFDPPRRLAVSWRHELDDDFRREGFTQVRYEIEPTEYGVKLIVIHAAARAGSPLLAALAEGWPGVVSSLKSLLETGRALPGTDRWPEGH